MEAIPYKLRLQLSDEIPQEGQRRVMARIPAFDAPEIDNSFFPLTGGGKTLRGMVLNMALGRFPAETAAFLRECLRPGIWTSPSAMSWMTVAVTATAGTPPPKSPGPSMNYAFALEFIGLAGPQDPKG